MTFSFKKYVPEAIPESPGLYAFQLRLVDLRMLGLRGNYGYTKEEVDLAKSKLIERLEWGKGIYESIYLDGTLKSLDQPKIGSAYRLRAHRALPLNTQNIKESLNGIPDIWNIVELLSNLGVLLPPLYVGITTTSGLRTRYNQHKYNFEKNNPGTLGARLRNAKLVWSDIDFYCLEYPTGMVDLETIKFCEQILHSFSNPIYSYA